MYTVVTESILRKFFESFSLVVREASELFMVLYYTRGCSLENVYNQQSPWGLLI